MRPRIDGPSGLAPRFSPRGGGPDGPREAAVAELFVDVLRRDVGIFFPRLRMEAIAGAERPSLERGPDFRLIEGEGGPDHVAMFGVRYRLSDADGTPPRPDARRMVRAVGAVASLRYHHLFHAFGTPASRLEVFRGESNDHYVSAFVEPAAYDPSAPGPSRIAATILTLRTAALSTYENRRVSTGALLIGPPDGPAPPGSPTPPDALPYGTELTALKCVHRLCDGERTLYQVDRDGRLAGVVDIARWADALAGPDGPDVPCARSYRAHARATRAGGHVCLVLSPHQEIKLFADGVQAFTFAHGRWRLLDPAAKFASWSVAVARPGLAAALFSAAVNLAEARRGALLVVLDDPARAAGVLIAPHDLIAPGPHAGPPPALAPGDPLARRALHYLARGRTAEDLDPAALEAFASLDGALVTDRAGRLLAFGAILRQDATNLPALSAAEGARTTAALVASRFGPVLKVSEDGIVSCFLDGALAWDL